jgi:hypothetical protein
MANAKKTVMKEITLWKKRLHDSKKVLNSVYKEVAKDARKAYREVTK